MKNLLITPAILLAGISLSTAAIANEHGADAKDAPKAEKKAAAKKMPMKKGMEMCYGIAKAGKNDCKTPDGKVSCAGSSKTDGDDEAFIIMPKGLCERIAGGMLKEHKE